MILKTNWKGTSLPVGKFGMSHVNKCNSRKATFVVMFTSYENAPLIRSAVGPLFFQWIEVRPKGYIFFAYMAQGEFMIKSILIASFTLVVAQASAVTEQEYLIQNKAYTDNLLDFYSKEEIQNKRLAQLKADKKTADSDLKKATTAVTATANKLAAANTQLTNLKNKQQNKPQLEADLNSQKQQNSSSINNLNSQISGKNNQLNAVNSEISQLENEKSLIQSKVNTQKQLVDHAQTNVNRIENEISDLERSIQQAQWRINNLQSDVQFLQMQKDQAQDPTQKQIIQNQINNKKNEIQNLKSDISFSQNVLFSKKNQLINEKSQLSQSQSAMSSLNIQLNGKQNEINSQVSIANQLKNSIASLKSQQNNLVQKNKAIDTELNVLANLPTFIADTEQNIVGLTAQKQQDDAVLTASQSQADGVSQALSQLQTQVDADKANVLAFEKSHDAVLKEFLATATAVSPAVIGEGTVSIDSITVTEAIAQNKDWSVIKGSSTTLGANICAASTRLLNAETGVLSELLVVKTMNADGSYSSPFVLTTHSMIPDLVVKGQLKTDKSKSIVLPILQSPVANEKALLTRYSDAAKVISSLKADNTTKIEFTIPGSPVVVPFSLKGSNAMINELNAKCKN